MNSENKKRLGDIINFKRGYDLPAYSRIEGKYPIISSGGITGYHSEYKKDGEGLITGRYGTLGEMYYVNGKYWPHNTALYATDFKGNYPKYVYYLMKCLGNLKTSDKSTVPGVNRNDLHEIAVPFIKPEFQKGIADFLYLIDSKIELDNHINAELEAMAKTIYDYWFVQFDFPDVNGKPYKTSGGKMIWNKELKREIPEGWGVDNILRLGELLGGGTPKTTEPVYWDGLIPFYTPSDSTSSFFVIETEKHISKIGLESCSSRLYPKGTIFITARGTVGNLNIASVPMAMNQSCYAVVAKDEINYYYLYQCCFDLIQYLKAKANGSIFDAIVSNDIKLTPISIPPSETIKKYGESMKGVFEKILANLNENQKLAELRDWLLPMLMNGQVKVMNEMETELSMAAEPKIKYGE